MINSIKYYKYNFHLTNAALGRVDTSQGWRNTAHKVVAAFSFLADCFKNGCFALAKAAVHLFTCCSRPVSSKDQIVEMTSFVESIQALNVQGMLEKYTSAQCDQMFKEECLAKLKRMIPEKEVCAEGERLRQSSGPPAFFPSGFHIQGKEGIRLAAQFSLLFREIYRKEHRHLSFSELIHSTGYPVWAPAIPWLVNQYYTKLELAEKFEAEYSPWKQPIRTTLCGHEQNAAKIELLKQIDPGIFLYEEGRQVADYHFFRIDWEKIRNPFGGDPNADRTYAFAHPQRGELELEFGENSFSMGNLSTDWSDRHNVPEVELD